MSGIIKQMIETSNVKLLPLQRHRTIKLMVVSARRLKVRRPKQNEGEYDGEHKIDIIQIFLFLGASTSGTVYVNFGNRRCLKNNVLFLSRGFDVQSICSRSRLTTS